MRDAGHQDKKMAESTFPHPLGSGGGLESLPPAYSQPRPLHFENNAHFYRPCLDKKL